MILQSYIYILYSLLGIKKIGRVSFPKILDPGPSLAERIAERRERAQRPPVALEDINIDNLSKNFDTLDHLIELHGHIVGMKLSPDHRYLLFDTSYFYYRTFEELTHNVKTLLR